jgi:hypothetical protein
VKISYDFTAPSGAEIGRISSSSYAEASATRNVGDVHLNIDHGYIWDAQSLNELAGFLMTIARAL